MHNHAMVRMPPEALTLPPLIKRLIQAECKGDWSRVVFDGTGGYTIYNTSALAERVRARQRPAPEPEPVKIEKASPVPVPPRVVRPKVQPEAAPTPPPAPAPVRPPEPVSRPEPVEAKAQQPAVQWEPPKAAPTRRDVAKMRQDLLVARERDAARRQAAVKDAAAEREALMKILPNGDGRILLQPRLTPPPAEARWSYVPPEPERPPLTGIVPEWAGGALTSDYQDAYEETPKGGWDLDWEPLPGVRTPVDWKTIIELQEAEASAFAILRYLSQGVGDRVPIMMHAQVEDLDGIDFAEAKSVMRQCAFAEVDGSTKERGYPVIRFVRGDLMVVGGFRWPGRPMVIAAYWEPMLCNLYGNGSNHAIWKSSGGGGSRKEVGLPKTPNQLISRLRGLTGIELPHEWELKETIEIVYKGESLGSVSLKKGRDKVDVGRDYQRILRKWTWLIGKDKQVVGVR